MCGGLDVTPNVIRFVRCLKAVAALMGAAVAAAAGPRTSNESGEGHARCRSPHLLPQLAGLQVAAPDL